MGSHQLECVFLIGNALVGKHFWMTHERCTPTVIRVTNFYNRELDCENYAMTSSTFIHICVQPFRLLLYRVPFQMLVLKSQDP